LLLLLLLLLTALVHCCLLLAQQVEELVTATAALEREVAEVRQLREEEDQLLLATLNAMGRVWAELLAARAASGRALTNIQFSVVQLPDQDDVPLQQVGWRGVLSRSFVGQSGTPSGFTSIESVHLSSPLVCHNINSIVSFVVVVVVDWASMVVSLQTCQKTAYATWSIVNCFKT
jgi:hypothetical protein